MIDFRYFLISIVAVFLALAVGIVLGSGVLGGPILKGLENRADRVVNRNEGLRNDITDLETELDQDQEFADAVEPELVSGELFAHEVILVQQEGTDGTVTDGIEKVVDEAGGEVATRIVLLNKLSLESEADAKELAGILGADTSSPRALREELGAELGVRLGAAAGQQTAGPKGGFPRVRAEDFLTSLKDGGFINFEALTDLQLVPPSADLVAAAGATDPAPYDVASVFGPLARRAAAQEMAVAITETSDSAWEVVARLRANADFSARVSTIDDGDTVPGRVSLVMSLSGATGAVGHWGTDDGAEALLPSPSP